MPPLAGQEEAELQVPRDTGSRYRGGSWQEEAGEEGRPPGADEVSPGTHMALTYLPTKTKNYFSFNGLIYHYVPVLVAYNNVTAAGRDGEQAHDPTSTPRTIPGTKCAEARSERYQALGSLDGHPRQYRQQPNQR